jgi:serine/threonine-protein kinase RsbW
MEWFMLLITKCRCIPENESDVEIAVREALENAVVHGNHEDPSKHIYVRCRLEPDAVSISIRDEGQGFDINKVPDPTSQENIQSCHGRGIYLMKALMDEVQFEEGGVLVRMRKRSSANGGTQPGNLASTAVEGDLGRQGDGRLPCPNRK